MQRTVARGIDEFDARSARNAARGTGYRALQRRQLGFGSGDELDLARSNRLSACDARATRDREADDCAKTQDTCSGSKHDGISLAVDPEISTARAAGKA